MSPIVARWTRWVPHISRFLRDVGHPSEARIHTGILPKTNLFIRRQPVAIFAAFPPPPPMYSQDRAPTSPRPEILTPTKSSRISHYQPQHLSIERGETSSW